METWDPAPDATQHSRAQLNGSRAVAVTSPEAYRDSELVLVLHTTLWCNAAFISKSVTADQLASTTQLPS